MDKIPVTDPVAIRLLTELRASLAARLNPPPPPPPLHQRLRTRLVRLFTRK